MPDYNTYSDQELITLLKEGNQQAFEALYHAYKVRVARNLLRLLKSDELAEELLQAMFVKIWENRKQIDAEQSFKAYLFRISENMVYDFFRKMARDQKLHDKLKAEYIKIYTHIEEGIYKREQYQQLSEAIDQLPPQRKQVFILCKIEGKSYKEVSELLGISPSTINNQLLLANKSLKKILNPGAAITISMVVMALLDTR